MATNAKTMEKIQLPLMRSKRHHKKSRMGCLRCKRRRVKCDERLPSCTACAVRSEACVWPEKGKQTVATDSAARQDQSIPDDEPSPISSPYLVLDFNELETSEMELTQCYLSRASHSLGSGRNRPDRDWVWNTFVPSLAFRCSAVRDGMHTFAAIFLHFSEPQGTSKYLDAANFYGTRFVEASRKQLARLDPSESDANMICARLLFVLGLAFHREYRSQGFQYSNPMMWTWAHMLSGIKTIHHSILESGQVLDPTLRLEMIPPWQSGNHSAIGENGSPVAPEVYQLMAYIQETQQERFAALHVLVLGSFLDLSDEQQVHCLHAIQVLQEATNQIQLVERQNLTRVLGACIANMHSEFLNMLVQQNHVALAIYAHWLMMLVLTEDLWVIDDMGRAGIRAILDTVDEPAMEPALSVPRNALTFSRIV